MERPQDVLMTILIINTSVNICYFSVASMLLGHIGSDSPLVATATALATFLLIILFGEVLPKALAYAEALKLAPLVAPLVKAVQVASAPVRLVLERLFVTPATNLVIDRGGTQEERLLSADELASAVQLWTRQGVLDSRENELLQEIVALPETSVRSVMIPRVDLVSIRPGAKSTVIWDAFSHCQTGWLVVSGANLDDIKGVVSAREFHLNHHTPFRKLLQPARFVPEQADLLHVIEHFRSTPTRVAIVVDEYGGTAGLVTLERVLAQIVGRVALPDSATTEQAVVQIDENQYRLSGRLGVRAIAQYVPINRQLHRADTLAGLVLALLGRVARIGDRVRISNIELVVEEMTGKQISRLLLRRIPNSGPGEETA
jgi:putative hemolysin